MRHRNQLNIEMNFSKIQTNYEFFNLAEKMINLQLLKRPVVLLLVRSHQNTLITNEIYKLKNTGFSFCLVRLQ